MTAPKFENQPYFQEAIHDSRVLEVMGLLGQAKNKREQAAQYSYAGHGQEPEQPGELTPENIHTVETLKWAGSDGESFSGYIALLGVTTVDGRELAAIKSWQFSHSTGLPAHDSSWTAEFDDPDIAEDFWNNHWKPHFQNQHFIESANSFILEQKIKRGIRYYNLGLLKPWYLQTKDAFPLLDRYATTPDHLVETPPMHKPLSEFRPGQVYRAPQRHWYTIKPHAYEPRTCLAAFQVKQIDIRGEERVSPAIQWDNGQLDVYSDSREELPIPLQRQHIARATTPAIDK